MRDVLLQPAGGQEAIGALVTDIGLGRLNIVVRRRLGAGGRNLHQSVDGQLPIAFLEQFLDLLLGFVVLAFAEVVIANVAGGIDQIIGRPV